MRITRTTFMLLVSVIIFSIFLANVANLLSNDLYDRKVKKPSVEVRAMTDKNEHLIWFLQVMTNA